MISNSILPRSFYDRSTIEVCHDILGKYLVHHIDDEVRVGKIVEVEAYLGVDDLASHSSKGVTPRTKTMFGPPGHAYVYLIYGIHHCMNVVTEKAGQGCAILIRALEPIQNLSARTNGPGLLSHAMQINKSLNNHDVTQGHFYLTEPHIQKNVSIVARPRIGVDYAGEWAKKLLRFYIKDNPYVSKT